MTEPTSTGPDAPSAEDVEPRRPRRTGRYVLLALVACLLVAAGGVAGALLTGSAKPPGDTSAEAGFARDMQTHHAQAVDMAMIIRDNSDDREIRTLAYDIALTQQEQIGQMHGWLTQWGLPQTGSQPPMAWTTPDGNATADTGDDTRLMPGMATRAELDRLEQLQGKQAEILFLTLMIRHHRAGVTMADAVVARTDRPEVRRLAHTMSVGQTREIKQMQRLIAQRGAPPA